MATPKSSETRVDMPPYDPRADLVEEDTPHNQQTTSSRWNPFRSKASNKADTIPMAFSVPSSAEPIDTENAQLPADIYVQNQMKSVRLGFIRKVYSILTLQLIVTAAMIAIFISIDAVTVWVRDPSHRWLYWVSIFLPIILLIPLYFTSRKHPWNMIFLFIWTLVTSYSVAFICTWYDTKIVLQSAIITSCVFIALTLFCFQSKIDFHFLGAALFASLFILLVWGLIQIFFPMGPVARFVYSLFGAIIFCMFILYDTSNIIKRLSPDDYIIAAIDLYLDVINLFLFILSASGKK